MKHTSLRFPRWPILKTFPATLFRPRPKLKLYLFHALLTISELSMYGGTTTAVTVSLNHSSFWVQFFKPHASTASLQQSRESHGIDNLGTKNIHIVLEPTRRKNIHLVALPNRLCLAITCSSPSSKSRSRAALSPYSSWMEGVYGQYVPNL